MVSRSFINKRVTELPAILKEGLNYISKNKKEKHKYAHYEFIAVIFKELGKLTHKKRVTLYKYNPFIILPAPLIDQRYSFSTMYELGILSQIPSHTPEMNF